MKFMSHQLFFLPLNPQKGTSAINKHFRCLQLKPLQGFGVKKQDIKTVSLLIS
jgi:hypothetical protein